MSAVVNPTVQAMMPLARMLVKQFQDMYSTMSGPKKGMKPVNAFMAFRAYYEGLFPGVEQKEKSRYLTFLWHQEKKKGEQRNGRWNIIAMAFTIVRDIAVILETVKPKMKEFLGYNAPFLGLALPPQATDIEEAQRYLTSINAVTGLILVEDVIANSLVGGLLPGIYTPSGANQPVVATAAPAAPAHNYPLVAMPAGNPNPYNMINGFIHNPAFVGLPSDLNIYSNDLLEKYIMRVNAPNVARVAESLMYHGGTDDEVEFSENSEVQTDFNPVGGDPWTAYDITVSSSEIAASILQF